MNADIDLILELADEALEARMADLASVDIDTREARKEYAEAREKVAAGPAVFKALERTLDALYNETCDKDNSPWIESVKRDADAIIVIAKAGGDIWGHINQQLEAVKQLREAILTALKPETFNQREVLIRALKNTE